MDGTLSQISSSYIFPTVIFIVMFGLGAALNLSMLVETMRKPKALAVGLAGQFILLPLAAFAVAFLGPWPAFVAIALIVIASCPGGSTSNALVFSIRGDVALSVSLTAVSSILTLFTIPLILGFAFQIFSYQESEIVLPVARIIRGLATSMVLPIILGMLFRHFFVKQAEMILNPLRKLSLILILMIIALSLYNARNYVGDQYLNIFLASLCLALIILPGAVLLAKFSGLSDLQGLAITIEVGVQNTVIAIYIVSSLLNQPQLSVLAITYGILNYTLIGAIIYFYKKARTAS